METPRPADYYLLNRRLFEQVAETVQSRISAATMPLIVAHDPSTRETIVVEGGDDCDLEGLAPDDVEYIRQQQRLAKEIAFISVRRLHAIASGITDDQVQAGESRPPAPLVTYDQGIYSQTHLIAADGRLTTVGLTHLIKAENGMASMHAVELSDVHTTEDLMVAKVGRAIRVVEHTIRARYDELWIACGEAFGSAFQNIVPILCGIYKNEHDLDAQLAAFKDKHQIQAIGMAALFESIRGRAIAERASSELRETIGSQGPDANTIRGILALISNADETKN